MTCKIIRNFLAVNNVVPSVHPCGRGYRNSGPKQLLVDGINEANPFSERAIPYINIAPNLHNKQHNIPENVVDNPSNRGTGFKINLSSLTVSGMHVGIA